MSWVNANWATSDWVSDMGRRFLQAYTEGLAMSCPMHRSDMDSDMAASVGMMAAAIDQSQADVRGSFRPEYAQHGQEPVHH
ncbi:hypothetical protein [Novosphingobium sp.]|uniref:hypothetical protein n=1 Tax=Novosphingobium sp. TaxID=1874826 RepID=UPI003340CE2D